MGAVYRLDELARRVGGRVFGDPNRAIRGVATLEQAGPDELAFFANPRYREAARATRAGAVLVGPGVELSGTDRLEVGEPYVALAELLELFHPPLPRQAEISARALVADGVRLGRDVAIGPFAVIGERSVLGDRVTVGAGCVVGADCSVGEDSELKPRVVLYPGTQVGARCLVHSGAVLGADGFGFATGKSGRHRKIPQLGRVVVEDDVEIGANTAVDRATLGETRLGAGSKLDDLVMVAHGVQLGPGCLLAGQAGIAGSTRVGARSTFAGQAGAAGHLALGAETVVAAKSALLQDFPGGGIAAGIPALDHRRWKRIQAELKRLPELRREVNELRARLAVLEGLPGPRS
ncbi:MAG TPA: UDP-3-O-(3-hydroxymyristoyl)glucosamine N-acyltransferase [Candidatus Polarisedimenticolaceae bacterium]|nr:UDP-3-O-(3-hydroxymyristoyl)glucosamine N-acyltransferase [Candidatus Polarisedimenticolaceae bacterium]